MTITHVLFDWDGTLARTLDLWLMGYQRSFEKRSLTFDACTIVKEFFHNHHEVPARHPDIDFAAIAGETLAFVQRNAAHVALYDDAIQALDQFRKQGVATSLVSSSARGLLEIGLDAHDLAPRFGSTIAGTDGFGHKPDTRPFRETLSRMKAAPHETLVIGDSHVDIEAGQAMGCQTCLFAPTSNRLFHDHAHSLSYGPDYVVESWNEVVETLPIRALADPAQ